MSYRLKHSGREEAIKMVSKYLESQSAIETVDEIEEVFFSKKAIDPSIKDKIDNFIITDKERKEMEKKIKKFN